MKDKVLIISAVCALFVLSLFTVGCEDEFKATERAGEKYLEKNLEKGEFEMYLTRYDTVCGYHYDSTFVKNDTAVTTIDTVYTDNPATSDNPNDSIIDRIDTVRTITPIYDVDTVTIPKEELPSYNAKIHKYKIDEYDDIPFIPSGTSSNATPVQTFDNGLQYAVYWNQSPPTWLPYSPQYVKLNYKAYFIDGSVLEGGRNRTLVYDNLPYGVKFALRKMTIGSRWRIWLPADLAYGKSGSEADPKIDPNTVLIYDIELLGF